MANGMQMLWKITCHHADGNDIKSDVKQKVKYGHMWEQCGKKVTTQSFAQVIEVILNKNTPNITNEIDLRCVLFVTKVPFDAQVDLKSKLDSRSIMCVFRRFVIFD